jgi:hypothetical protein
MDTLVTRDKRSCSLAANQGSESSLERPSRADAEQAVRTLIRWAGDDPNREGRLDTPARVVRAHEQWFAGYRQDPGEHLARTFDETNNATEHFIRSPACGGWVDGGISAKSWSTPGRCRSRRETGRRIGLSVNVGRLFLRRVQRPRAACPRALGTGPWSTLPRTRAFP